MQHGRRVHDAVVAAMLLLLLLLSSLHAAAPQGDASGVIENSTDEAAQEDGGQAVDNSTTTEYILSLTEAPATEPIELAPEMAAAHLISDTPVCPGGYRLTNGRCGDINECDEFIDTTAGRDEDKRDACGNYVHSHRPGYRCVNTPGSYRCERIVDCGFGYVLNESLGLCIDINECEILGYERACGLKLPIKICVNLDGTFRCEYRSCRPGMYMDRSTGQCNHCQRGFAKNSRGICQDIDECERLTTHDCLPHMRCVNFIGGYDCRHKIFCPMGRRTNYNGSACHDINECAEQPSICGVFRDCINTDGAYNCEMKKCGKMQKLNIDTGECVCTDGHRMNKTSSACEDINECLEGSHNCEPNDVCRNSRGHFDCLSRDKVCEPGFGLNFEHTTCVDIDECKLGQYKCGRNEYCNNTHGSYTCLCTRGFQRLSSAKECTDIDECSSGSACGKPFVCLNIVGTFDCVCPAGYRRAGDGCADADECLETPGICGSGRCENRPTGSYTCVCPPGYMATDSTGGTCVDINECSLKACPASADCLNTPGGYDCKCPSGFRFVRSNNECEDIDECQQLSNACEANLSCFNYRGRYSCYRDACPEGFHPSGAGRMQRTNLLSFSCSRIGCKLVPSFLGNGPAGDGDATSMCVLRYRIVHKAHEIKADSGEFASIQSDMRYNLRSCLFKAVLTQWDGRETVHTSMDAQHADLLFNQKEHNRYTICSTQLRLSNSTSGVTKVQLEVALIGRTSVDISRHTVHIVRL